MRFRYSLLAVIVLTGSAPIANAQWTGAATGSINDTTHSYLTTVNWTSGTVQDTFTRTLTTPGASIYFSGPRTFGTFTIVQGGAFPLTFLGGGLFDAGGVGVPGADQTLTINTGITVTTGSNVTIGSFTPGLNLNLDLAGGTRNFNIASSQNLTVLNVISNGGIDKTGTGSLTLNGANTYSGTISVRAGNLFLGNASALGSGGSSILVGDTVGTTAAGLLTSAAITITRDLTVQAGSSGVATLGGNGAFASEFSGTVTLNKAVTLSQVTGGTTTFSGIISGGFAVTKTGVGMVILSNTNTYTGLTTVSGGTLSYGANNVIATGAVTVTSGALALGAFSDTVGTVTLNGSSASITGTGTLTSTGSFEINEGSASVVLAGLGINLNKIGSGNTAILSGLNSYTGVTTISAGTLSVNTINNGGVAGGIGQATNAATNLVFNGGTLSYTGVSASSDRNFIISPATTATIGVNTGINLTLTGTNTGTTGALTKSGLGTLTLNAPLNHTGLTTVSGGTLTYGASNIISDNGAVTVTGGILSLGAFNDTVGTVTLGSGSASSITGTGTLTSTGSFEINEGSASVVLAGTNINLNKIGSGNTAILSGLNSYTGVTKITAGTLNVGVINDGGQAGNLGAATSTNTNLVFDGGTLNYTGNSASTNRSFVITSGKSAFISVATAATNLTISGSSTDTNGAINKSGAGTLALTGDFNYAGTTTVSGGTLAVANLTDGGTASSLGASSNAAANLLLNNGTTLSYVGIGQSSNRSFTLNSSSSSDGATLDASGTGALNLINTATPGYGTNNLTRFLTLTGSNTGDNTLAALIANNGSGALTLTKNGTGTWVLSNANTYTGSTTINGGILSTSNLQNGGTASGIGASTNVASNLVFNGGTLRYTGSVLAEIGRSFTISTGGATFDQSGTGFWKITGSSVGSLSSPATITLQGSTAGTGEISGVLANITGSDPLSLVKLGTGTWTLSGTNTYTGSTTVTNGTLRLGAAGTINAGSAAIVNATLDLNGFSNSFARLSGSGTINGSSGTPTLTSSGAVSTDFSGAILNAGGVLGFAKGGSSTQTLSGVASSYTGITTINASGGVLAVAKLADGNSNSSIGAGTSAAGNLLIGASSTLRYVGTGDTSNRLFTLNGTAAAQIFTLDASGTGALNLNNTGSLAYGLVDQTRTLTLTGTNTGDNTLAAVVANNDTALTAVTKSGTGTWVLSNANTYTGVTTISRGVLSVSTLADGGTASGIGASTNAATNLVFNAGGTLRYTGANVVSNRSLTLSTAGTIEVADAGTTLTLANAFGSTGALTKTGAGTLALSGTNSNTGAFNINNGTLLINGSTHSNSTINVSSGALGGTGIVNGPVSVGASGIINPGESPGKLTLANTLTFVAGGKLYVELNGTTASVSYDQLALTTTGTLAAINLTNATLDGSVGVGFTPSASDKFFIIDKSGTIGYTGGFNGGANSVSFGIYTFDISYVGNTSLNMTTGGNDVVLYNAQPVPEPANILLLASAGAGIAGWVRRRRASRITSV